MANWHVLQNYPSETYQWMFQAHQCQGIVISSLHQRLFLQFSHVMLEYGIYKVVYQRGYNAHELQHSMRYFYESCLKHAIKFMILVYHVYYQL